MVPGQAEADWRRAIKALRAAETLLDVGLPEDAVSRAYYAVLHAARAALVISGATARTHTGIRRLFGSELVDRAGVEPEWAKVLAHAQSARESADYDTATELPEERAAVIVDQARRFIERMASYLKAQGVEPPTRM